MDVQRALRLFFYSFSSESDHDSPGPITVGRYGFC